VVSVIAVVEPLLVLICSSPDVSDVRLSAVPVVVPAEMILGIMCSP
jgi:hypothetical protein